MKKIKNLRNEIIKDLLWTKIRSQFSNSSIKCHFKDIGNNLKKVYTSTLCNINKLLNLFDVRMILYACRDVY